MKYILLISSIVLLLRCGKKDEIISFEHKTITFKLNFEPNHMLSGLHKGKNAESSFYYFGELKTNKKIDFYQESGKQLNSINLKTFIKELGSDEIRDLAVMNKDSILLFSEKTNSIYLINSRGKLLKKININKIRDDYTCDLFSSIYHNFYDTKNESLIFAQNWSINNQFPDSLTKSEEIIQQHYNQKRMIPKYVQVKNVLENNGAKIENHLAGFNAKLFPKNSLSFEFDYYYLSGDLLFFSSWYSDKIMVYDLLEKKIVRKVKIQSNFTKTYSKTLDINRESINEINDYIRLCGSFNGQINRFFYDPENKLLYVLVYHEQKNHRSHYYGVNRDWSLLVYDHSNNKIYEKAFKHDQYSIGFSLFTDQGLLVRKFNENGAENQIDFDCFSPILNR